MYLFLRRLCSIKYVTHFSTKCSKVHNFSTICLNPVFAEPICSYIYQYNLQFCRYKSKDKSKKQQVSDTGSEESDKDFIDDIQDKYTKILKVNLNSMRLDTVLKSGLGLSRNKLETIFYESKIRLNGEKVLKKSAHIEQGDEIDVIKGVNIKNKDFLTVARVEVLSVTPKEENISVKIRQSKSLVVENYKGNSRWEE